MSLVDEIFRRGYPLSETDVRTIIAAKTAEAFAENATLRERIRTLEAGIEQEAEQSEAAACAYSAVDMPAIAELSEERAARLRALLK